MTQQAYSAPEATLRVTPAQLSELAAYWQGVDDEPGDVVELHTTETGILEMFLLKGRTLIDSEFRADRDGEPA